MFENCFKITAVEPAGFRSVAAADKKSAAPERSIRSPSSTREAKPQVKWHPQPR